VKTSNLTSRSQYVIRRQLFNPFGAEYFSKKKYGYMQVSMVTYTFDLWKPNHRQDMAGKMCLHCCHTTEICNWKTLLQSLIPRR